MLKREGKTVKYMDGGNMKNIDVKSLNRDILLNRMREG